jgi:hypothetical protein
VLNGCSGFVITIRLGARVVMHFYASLQRFVYVFPDVGFIIIKYLLDTLTH